MSRAAGYKRARAAALSFRFSLSLRARRPSPADAAADADGEPADDDYKGGAARAGGAEGAAAAPATRLEALRACSFEGLECVRAAHALPAGGAKFNFPHFMIIGFQKAATTSLNAYLDKHPQVQSD